MTLLGWLIFIFALLFSIMLHEAGHFVMAKKFHMKVTQFFVGFGRTLWSRQKGETEYGVKAIPAGGYVKIIGMTALEDVDPADEPRSFRQQPRRRSSRHRHRRSSRHRHCSSRHRHCSSRHRHCSSRRRSSPSSHTRLSSKPDARGTPPMSSPT